MEDDVENWGTSRADYYNADVIETEADALEEEHEARRLQQKQLKDMTEADFGFDESAWADDAREKRSTVEKLPELQIPENATANERLRILQSRYPEFEPLTKDFLALQGTYQALKKEADLHNDVAIMKYRALSAYLGSIAMYLALLTSSKSGVALAPAELREHPVMANLLRCRQLWQQAQLLRELTVAETKPEQLPTPLEEIVPPPAKKPKKEKAQRKEASPEPAPAPAIPTRRRERKSKRNDLQDLLDASMKKPAEAGSDFGDEAPLTIEEAADKARRKKTLSFYTSQTRRSITASRR